MALDAAQIENRLAQAMPRAKVTIEDPRGDGKYLAVTIIDASFVGLSLIDQHRLVFKALGEESIDPPPVISLHTRAPA